MNTADYIAFGAMGVATVCLIGALIYRRNRRAPAAPMVPFGAASPTTGAAFALQTAARRRPAPPAPSRRTYGAPKPARVVIHDDINTDTTDDLLTGIVLGSAIESLMDSPSVDTSDDTFTGGGGDFGGGGASGSWGDDS